MPLHISEMDFSNQIHVRIHIISHFFFLSKKHEHCNCSGIKVDVTALVTSQNKDTAKAAVTFQHPMLIKPSVRCTHTVSELDKNSAECSQLVHETHGWTYGRIWSSKIC